jgi:hypothetical protein
MEARVVQKPYAPDLRIASSEHSGCEARVSYLARQLAELVEHYEGVNFTLRRQRDASQAELRELRRAS